MPKRPTPPSANMLLKKKTTSTKKAAKKPKTKETKSIEPPSLPIPHESQAALIASGGDMLIKAPSLIVVGEHDVTGAGKTITLGHIMLNEAKKMVRARPCLTTRYPPTSRPPSHVVAVAGHGWLQGAEHRWLHEHRDGH